MNKKQEEIILFKLRGIEKGLERQGVNLENQRKIINKFGESLERLKDLN